MTLVILEYNLLLISRSAFWSIAGAGFRTQGIQNELPKEGQKGIVISLNNSILNNLIILSFNQSKSKIPNDSLESRFEQLKYDLNENNENLENL
ncbi:hypothetical protein Glove_300g8 [Diversispora epigaea]|uniref:Uncharacterized protein n=1 Tax=Diversispora epigaea TaxID=1348612 RepID=A0A397HWH4_9GLOM|nr:hypothetical protein Glove_300g8 [Diversispora epigaea]